ncbi:MAG: NAD(+)/NADH kinase [Thermoguttaceae bacterium]
MRVILLGNSQPESTFETVQKLSREIGTFCEVVFADFSDRHTIRQPVPEVDADIAIVFGGDGAIIRAARQMRYRQLPTIAVHLGTLGFLSTVQTGELLPLLRRKDLLTFPVVEHILLQCRVCDAKGNVVADELALNEVSLQGGQPFRLTHIELLNDEEQVTVYRCDGLILSTPIGSTAHNLSAGGPILRKELDAISICPISPHTLSHRPVVDSANRRYALRILDADRQAVVVVDGAELATVSRGDEVVVTRAPVSFKLLKLPHYSYYQTLRDKLGWGGSLS